MRLLINQVYDVLNENAKKIFNIELDSKYVQNSTKKEFGDFQTNFAMVNAKTLGKNPREIAQEFIDKFDGKGIIEKLELAGPGFINIFVAKEKINDEIKKFGKEKFDYEIPNDRLVVIDYSSPNIAKRMHIGHLRSTIIGDSIKKIYEEIGFKVLGDNHIGDWGTQFGKLIVAYNKWLNREAYEKDAIEELERLYVLFSTESKKDPSLEEQAREELRKVQIGDPVNLALWKEFIAYSMKEYNKVYDRLNIKFELVNGESFYNDMMPGVLEDLKKRGIAKEDDGALVVFFDEDKLPPCIVQKKDGSFLYSTSDLAKIKYVKDELGGDISIYVVDERQQGHFKQVFEIAKMLGAPYDYEKHHTQFGIMRFGNGVILSSRGGNVIHLTDLLDQAKEQVRKVVDVKNPDLSDEEKDKISEAVGVCAIKYFDLSQNRTSPILFEWDRVLSFEGNTGPYLLYTYVRINSILNKVNSIDENQNVLVEGSTPLERELVSTILKLPTSVIKAYETKRPNVIADYIYDLAKKFNSFYNSEKILTAPTEELKNARVLLSQKVGEALKKGLGLLGIKTVDKM
ncbi:arginine--tRNA ligase [Sneathia sp. DSM 16631]|uniref:arginine--tRNA ligase n=1 Tax=Sneathia TaxID=168808 RepID=UPI001866D3F1|nr:MULTISPECIES: arginine--tRNA ligase [Sneathia]MBE3031506.1 arginine--tRNA ligase [Sneathia sp. DSM 16631]MDK9582515.1 arginine--tRNA ligase [Sneathia vaginalis]